MDTLSKIDGTHFKFDNFFEELHSLQQELENDINLLKSSVLSPLISYLLASIGRIWESEYRDIENRDSYTDENHPIFGRVIRIKGDDFEVNCDDLVNILKHNGTTAEALKDLRESVSSGYEQSQFINHLTKFNTLAKVQQTIGAIGIERISLHISLILLKSMHEHFRIIRKRFNQLNIKDLLLELSKKHKDEEFKNHTSDKSLCLYMDQKYALSFTAEANRIKIPSELDWLQILGVREKNYDIRYLLKTLDSSSIRTFIFGGSLDEPLSGEELVGFYLPVLEYMLSIGEVILTNCYFTSSSFESLLKIGFKIYELTLENCRFDFKRELCFECLGYKLAIITLRHCFYDNLHSQSITFIKTICNGIVECSYLKHTLRSFQIEYPSNDDFQSCKYKPITLDDYTGLLQIDRFECNVNDCTRQLFYNYSRDNKESAKKHAEDFTRISFDYVIEPYDEYAYWNR